MSKSRGGVGSYYEPWPLDYTILGILPEVGTIGGVHWKGRRAKDVAEELNIEGVDSVLVTARLRSMKSASHVETFPGAQGTKIWARTPKGTTLMEKGAQHVA